MLRNLKFQRVNRIENKYRYASNAHSHARRRVSSERNMKPAASTAENDSIIKNSERRKTSLSAATLQSISPFEERSFASFAIAQYPNSEVMGTVSKVLSASLLVTGNTVGSSMFVLPDTVEKVGMVWGSAIFIVLYIYNLVSGLMIADVAINLHESSDCDVPSSFKDFADCAMKDQTAGTAIGAASLLMNSCFLAYGFVQVGSFVASALPGLGVDPTTATAISAALFAWVSYTQTNEGIEKIANAAVMVLFSSFASLLLPSLANVHDPMETFLAPGSHPEGFSAAISTAVPLILSTLIYQNIVPSITKLLKFDRTNSTIAIALGSFIPLAMYVAWCFAVLGGGLDNSLSSGAGGAMFAAFTASSFIGSSIGCIMSLAEEYESIIASKSQEEVPCTLKDTFSAPAVLMSVLPPAAVAVAVSSGGDLEFTGPLHLAGAVITPFLYGILPIMLFKSMQPENRSKDVMFSKTPQLLLGASTVGILGHEIIQDFGNWVA
ncbi:hypothetical protein HJC23_007672 [Cyclotella cryptica]|uniref:Tryptophan/tyrosine permease n=1 Tax=Cyclotella cryptica TaxID=29204 RepID=A0ABD3PQS7_9STRA